MNDPMMVLISLLAALVVILPLLYAFLVAIGAISFISERQVGVIVKKFSTRNLPPGRLIALNGEAGYQADTLAPGLHLGYWRWQYVIHKVPVTMIPQGEIGLIVAAEGAPIPSQRMLGRVVDCDNFQNARKYLANGGEKGRQLGILTAGTYRINTALFTVITSMNAKNHGMEPWQLQVHQVYPDEVGIVTTLDGVPIPEGEIAGPTISGHNNFQNAQAFIEREGSRGLQEQVLLSGSWNLNPWFVQVEQVAMTEIPIGYVGVVISFVGRAHEDVSGADFKHGDLVNVGHKGVWITPLYPGKHPINTRIMRAELVPTTNIVLNWANRTESHGYDDKLNSITVRSKDGFAFNLDVSQIIHVGALDAPKVISRVGSMQNLVDHVLQPIVGNYFRNSAQYYTVLDFLSARSERQGEAASHIRVALGQYNVEAVDTLIGDIVPPGDLMQTQTDRKLAEERKLTYEVQEIAQKQRQQLVRETAIADIQQNMVSAEQGVNIAELEAKANIKHATGEAEAIRLRAKGEAEAIRATGQAQAEAYQAGVVALGPEEYTTIQVMQIIGQGNVRIVPEVQVTGSERGGLVDGLLASVMRERVAGNGHNGHKTEQAAD
jgi:uncharacterized membrane protein YqiK